MQDLVFVHGLGESARCFDELRAHPDLAHVRTHAPDLPGYGDEAAPNPLSLDEVVAWLAAWARARGLAGTWVGHSLGGVLVTLVAERYPDLVAGLVDIDGNLSGDDTLQSRVIAASSLELFQATGFDRLAEALQSHVDATNDRAVQRYLTSLRRADRASLHRHAIELVALSRSETLAARLAAVPVPVVYLAGVPGGVSRRSLGLLDRAGVRWRGIEPSGHWPFVDRLDDVARELVSFLALA